MNLLCDSYFTNFLYNLRNICREFTIFCVHISILSRECTLAEFSFANRHRYYTTKYALLYKIKCILFVALLLIFYSLRYVQCVYYLVVLFLNTFKQAECVCILRPCKC
jgi:hypothetical protein